MEKPRKPNHSDLIIQWFKSETFWQGVAASTLSTGALSIGALIVAWVLGVVDWPTFAASVLGFILVACVTWVIVINTSTLGKQRTKIREALSNDQSGFSPGAAWIGILLSTLGLLVILTWRLALHG